MFFFFNDTATTEIYTLSLHDALPILSAMHPHEMVVLALPETLAYEVGLPHQFLGGVVDTDGRRLYRVRVASRSEEHTSELQSRQYLVCRLLLEKKKNNQLYKEEVMRH